MPHFFVEYSANIEKELDFPALSDKIVKTAVETGVFDLKGIRVRAVPRQTYRIADGHPDNAFVHTVVRVGSGRDVDTLDEAGKKVYSVICEHLKGAFESRPLNISMEIQEIHPTLTYKLNNTQDFMAERAKGKHAAE